MACDTGRDMLLCSETEISAKQKKTLGKMPSVVNLEAFFLFLLQREGMRQSVDFCTTTLRQGLSTAIARIDARMLAPAAMMKTRSQLPLDCCM